jgi:hypothetical protein
VPGAAVSQYSPEGEARELRDTLEDGWIPAERRQQDEAADTGRVATGECEGGGAAERLPAYKRWGLRLGVAIENRQGSLGQTLDTAGQAVQAMVER